jgi:hypothetical protein
MMMSPGPQRTCVARSRAWDRSEEEGQRQSGDSPARRRHGSAPARMVEMCWLGEGLRGREVLRDLHKGEGRR